MWLSSQSISSHETHDNESQKDDGDLQQPQQRDDDVHESSDVIGFTE